ARVAPVGRDEVLKVVGGLAPVPDRNHEVARGALRPLGPRERQRALLDRIGPLREGPEPRLAEPRHVARHRRARAARGDALLPGVERIDLAALPEHVRNRARPGRAERVARLAAACFTVCSHSLWLDILPSGNSLSSGTCMSENQYM